MAALAHGNSSSRKLVIFGCGYVGSALAEAALARGQPVVGLTRNPETARVLSGRGVQMIVADLACDDWHGQVRADPMTDVVNCVSSGGGGLDGYRRSYLEGMQSILRWAAKGGGVGTLVYTSSTSVYPQGGGMVVDESCPVWDLPSETPEGRGGCPSRPELQSSNAAATSAPLAGRSDPGVTGREARGRILVAAERALSQSTGACRRWFILRLAGIYGPGRHHLLDQVRRGVVSGVPSHFLNVIHRDDAVAAILACLDSPPAIANEIFNVADDSPTRREEVVKWLAARLGVPEPVATDRPAEGRSGMTPDRTISNRRLKEVLAWHPRLPSFREGYERSFVV